MERSDDLSRFSGCSFLAKKSAIASSDAQDNSVTSLDTFSNEGPEIDPSVSLLKFLLCHK